MEALVTRPAATAVAFLPYRTGALAAPDVMEGRVRYRFDNRAGRRL
jgi:hypothetical protein